MLLLDRAELRAEHSSEQRMAKELSSRRAACGGMVAGVGPPMCCTLELV